jgi:phytoene dehydrogenase-like protein
MRLKGKKVVVIGTGIGGSGVAALLAREGAQVIALERNSFPGGKAASLESEGFVYDTGVHWIARGDKGPLGEISRRVDGNIKFVSLEGGMRFMVGGRSTILTQNMDEEAELERVMEELGILPENRQGVKAFFRDMMKSRTREELEALESVALVDYVKQFVQDEQFNRMIEGFNGMYLVITPKQSSAAEFIYCFSTQARERNLSYPLGGVRAIPMDYLDALERMGGEIHFRRPVERIVVDRGKVVGVEAGGFIPADIVVSNTGIKETVELAGRHNFPADYLAMVDGLRLSLGAVSVKYALSAKVVKPHLIYYFPDRNDPGAMERHTGIFMTVPSEADPSLAPPGCQVVLAGSLVPPSLEKPETANAICEAALDRVENTVRDLFPDVENHVVWKMRTNSQYIANISGRKTGEVIGVAQNRFQVGKKRPPNATPVEGLYLVGADAGGRGVGTEMAADSALNLWRLLSS